MYVTSIFSDVVMWQSFFSHTSFSSLSKPPMLTFVRGNTACYSDLSILSSCTVTAPLFMLSNEKLAISHKNQFSPSIVLLPLRKQLTSTSRGTSTSRSPYHRSSSASRQSQDSSTVYRHGEISLPRRGDKPR